MGCWLEGGGSWGARGVGASEIVSGGWLAVGCLLVGGRYSGLLVGG